jgi:molybdopterin-guanine dinucleotide biosynthesis protein
MKADRPFVIGIGGAHSSIGKTTLAAALIKYLSSGRYCGLFGKDPSIGAIKYTREAIYASLIDDPDILRQKGKDSARLGDAGAAQVLWIKSSAEDIDEVLPLAMERMAGQDIVIIEGNSAIEFAMPDIIIFILGGPGEETKPSAKRLAGLADIFVAAKTLAGHPAGACLMADLPARVNDAEMEVIIKAMEETSRKKEIINLIRQRSEDGRLTCAAARRIAEELKVPYNEVGAAANELKIKIKNCELGCF